MEEKDFIARDYQVQLAEMAYQKNKIIFLPTGSGKTFISSLVLNHFLKQNDCVSKNLKEGGKRGFFLVNTVALVHQQVAQIRNKAPYEVKGYSGDMGVDFWDAETWEKEINSHGVLVMTSQIFLNLLLGGNITLKDVAVVVFDECHHGVTNHPMRQIMQRFKNVAVEVQPRVLGLTATLLNKNVAVTKVDDEIRVLETTFLSQIATADDENMVKLYSTNPQEYKVYYNKNSTTSSVYAKRDKYFEKLMIYIQSFQIDDDERPDGTIRPQGAHQIEDRSKKTNKELKNVLEDIKINMDELGLYGGDIAVLARLIQMQKMILHCQSEVSRTAFEVFNSDLVLLRKVFENEMGERDLRQKINDYSSEKVKQLFRIFRKMKEEDTAIVFVRRRFTAKIMHKIVGNAAKADPTLSHIKCDFVVGYNVSNPFKDTRENLLQRNYNNRVLDKFNQGLLNVLFGSNVVEEGMDISSCNHVIMFDPPMDFRSYTQSKGRARHSDSKYIIMTDDPMYEAKYNQFKAVERRLQELLCGGHYLHRDEPSQDEVDATLFANTPGLESYMPTGKDGPAITALSAISHVNRYFLSLKVDRFTVITPYWFMKTEGLTYKCYLHLPMESSVRGIVEGTWQTSKENAKRSVALEACKRLHQSGELDNVHLLPITIEAKAINTVNLLPHWDDEETFKIGTKKVGTKKNKRSWQKKWPEYLVGCQPVPSRQMFLHVLQLKVLYRPPPDNHRLVVFHETLTSPVTYAIVSAKPLPQLAPFPLYMSTGEIEVNVLEGKAHTFTEAQLQKISKFHGIIFSKIMDVVKGFLIRDYTNCQNSYLIAPVVVGANGIEVDYDVMEKANKPFPDLYTATQGRPSDKVRSSIEVTDENYLGKIVTPWYRTVPAQKYIVTKVCYDMNENSTFPSDNYMTYEEYFVDKYKITPLKKNQPLLEVRALSSRMNNLKPLALTKALKRKNKDENEDFEVWLVPEFLLVYPVPGRYWVKALLLPSVLHRVEQLCAAEELRVRLVRDVNIGLRIHPPGKPLKKLEADASLAKHIPDEVTQLLTPLIIGMQERCTVKGNPAAWGREEEPLDLDRDLDVTLFDVQYYEEFANAPLTRGPSSKGNIFTEEVKKEIPKFKTPPPLKMLTNNVRGLGPEQVQVLQAITAAVSNDFINCERLETLGDSFLKFAVSLALFEKEGDASEGALTNLKGKIVGNKNLYFCGKAKDIGSILEVKDFSPREEWIPPQFCVEHSMVQTFLTAELDPSALYKITIPEEEVFAGRLSRSTKEEIQDIILSADDMKIVQNCPFLNMLALTDKNISDAVEAILGVYLENSGIFGALRVMNWFGVMDQKLATEDVFRDNLTTPAKTMRGTPADHLIQPRRLEEILQYKFNDRAYLLQALTHPSYQRNNITQCYQRLEFLGDAIIDFLITIHIYERCTDLHPGDLTDLRSALVNNITLGCISVRHGLHRFLLQHSSSLNDIMSRFVRHQEERNHLIDNDILFLCEERETLLAEAIEVPKALGDVFEALVGAIYLDSGKNIDVTWKVIYNIMREEIENFSKDVPKNHVRLLYESNCYPRFSASVVQDGIVKVQVEVSHRGETITCNGFGDNKYQAKRAAAKQALRVIRGSLDN